MRRAALFASAALVLAGCGQINADGSQAMTEEAASGGAPAVDMAAEAPSPPTGRSADSPQVPEAQVPQLAYIYGYTLEVPTAQVDTLAARHEQACIQAGPAQCQVIGSSTQAYGADERQASLEMRAAPGWMTAFRNGLAADAERADGRIADSSTTSEDLTRAIIDTEAHLRAKTALRDRLQIMLATREGNLQTVLEVERELARVQAEIDAATSTLQVMRARVSMARVTVTYRSQGVLAPDSATAPLSAALENALGLSMAGLAAIVSVLAFLAPFALVLGPILWLILRARARKRAQRLTERARQRTENAAAES